MGTSVKQTAYESIPHFTRSLKIYDAKNMDSLSTLIEAMRAWNLHGSANRLEIWMAKMRKCIENEHMEYDWRI